MTDTAIEALKDLEPSKPPRSRSKDIWDQFTKHKGAMLGLGFLLFITLAVLVGPLIWTTDPQKIDIRNKDMRTSHTLATRSFGSRGSQRTFSNPSVRAKSYQEFHVLFHARKLSPMRSFLLGL